MAYTTETLVKNSLGRDLTSDEQALLALIIPAIKAWIDAKLESTFDEAEETTRKYDGNTQFLDIDPCTAITAVKHVDRDGNTNYNYVAADYVAEPVNETVKRSITLRDSKFAKGIANIHVTAKFSEYTDAVPSDIQALATRIATLYLASSGEGAGIQSESIEGHSISYAVDKVADGDRIVKMMINQRKTLLVG